MCARFDGGRLSSGGGVLLFPGIERRLGISDLLASCVTDARDPASTTHSYADMIRARMFAIACGYEGCDQLDALRFDPAFKLDCGRLAETGDDPMSQPTLSRLENAPSWRKLARMGLSLIDLFCSSFKTVSGATYRNRAAGLARRPPPGRLGQARRDRSEQPRTRSIREGVGFIAGD